MRWFRYWKQKPEQPKNVTPWSDMDWAALADDAEKKWHSTGAIVDAFRRMVGALETSERSATQLGTRISWLNVWLLVFTIAIFFLTGVLAWATLRGIGR